MGLPVLLLLCALAASAQTGSLTFSAFDDLNFDGLKQPGEGALPGVVMTLEKAGYAIAATNVDGLTSISGLTPGVYKYTATLGTGTVVSSEALGSALYANVLANQNTLVPVPMARPCVSFKMDSWVYNWPGLSTGQVCFTVTNNGQDPLTSLSFVGVGMIAFSPSIVNLTPPLAPGQSRQICVNFSHDFDEIPPFFCVRIRAVNTRNAVCWSGRCFQMPNPDCQVLPNPTFLCLEPNNYSMTFNLQHLGGWTATQLQLNPISPLNYSISPNNFNLNSNPMSPGETQSFTVNLSGISLQEGGTVCFEVVLREGALVCRKRVCVTLPVCNFRCFQPKAACSGARPRFIDNPAFNNPLASKNIAIVTCAAYEPNVTEQTIGIMNLEAYECMPNPYPGRGTTGEADFITYNGFTPRGFKHPNWSVERLGNLFGVCTDDAGNIYAAQSSAYNMDRKPNPALWPGLGGVITGRIFKIASNNPATVTVFNGVVGAIDQGIVSRPDPSITNRATSPYFGQPWSAVYTFDERYPEVGDVCYARLPNPTRRRIVASGMDEGMIYVYNMNGVIVQKYDPLGPDNPTQPGFAPYGEMVWAVEYHAGRLFYSVYTEDLGFAGTPNQIRSVAFNPATGLLVPSTDKAELNVPFKPVSVGQPGFQKTMPVSDISFKPDGRMGVAQRSMGFNPLNGLGFLEPLSSGWQIYESMVMHATPNGGSGSTAGKTSMFPHNSGVLEFACIDGRWQEVFDSSGGQLYRVGSYSTQQNACGGLDYDFRTICPDGSAARPRTWMTADAMNLTGSIGFFAAVQCPAGAFVAYGLQGAPFTGGNYLSSVLIDLNGIAGWCDKAAPGDVEIPCPPKGNIIATDRAGTLSSAIFDGTQIRLGHPYSFQIRSLAGTVLHEEGGTFGDARFLEVAIPDDLAVGQYRICIKPLGFLATCANVTVSTTGLTQTSTPQFWGGDYNDDNEVGPADFAMLALAFGSFAGEEAYSFEIDQNQDGEIGPADFAVVAANFGMFGE